MSVLVILELNANPGKGKDITDFLRDELKHTRVWDDCNTITVNANQEDPDNLVFVEDWDFKEQYEKYLAWHTEKGDIEQLVSLLSEPPSIRYFDNQGV